MRRTRSLVSWILTLLSIFAMALSWHSVYRAFRLPDELAEAYRQRIFPRPMLGLKLPLLRETLSVDGGPVPSSYPGTTLVLISDPTCSKSETNQPRWRQLVGALPKGRVDEIWILGYENDEFLNNLADYLAADVRIPFRVLRTRDEMTFGLRTGLSAVPDTLILDSQGRIQLNLVGILSQDDIALVHSELRGDRKAPTALARLPAQTS